MTCGLPVKMDTGKISSLLAILLLAILSCVDAWGTVQYFNVSNVRVRKGESIVFKCGATLEQTDGGVPHTLVVNIIKWFPGSMMKWTLTSNEEVDIGSRRYNARLNRINEINEFELTIMNAMLSDSGNYTCKTKRNNKTVVVDVLEEPSTALLLVNGRMVGNMDTDPAYAVGNKVGAQVVVSLEQTYMILCIVIGGNPPPSVSLSSGVLPGAPYQEVVVTRAITRDRSDRLSDPLHTANATMFWKATIKNIGMPFNCMAGLENTASVSTNFVPVLADSEPLFDCADKAVLAKGEDELTVSCRVISTRAALNVTTVHVFAADGKNFTIRAELPNVDYPYYRDPRYVVRFEPIPSTHSWTISLVIKEASSVEDLNSHKLEFLADNLYDSTAHTVTVEADVDTSDGSPSASRMTISMVVVLFTMILGAFY